MSAADSLRVTAHHEAGHSVAAVMRGGGELLSVTIEPDEDCLGRTWQRLAKEHFKVSVPDAS